MHFAFLLASLVTLTSASGTVHLNLIEPDEFRGDRLVATSDATRDTPMLKHYGKPPEECESGEIAIQIQGVPGATCAPKCDASGGCPTDVPDGVTATPQCALENASTGDKYCVLICHEAMLKEAGNLRLRVGDAQCGDATCQIVQPGLGLCTYE